jgi:hypothetical protein
MRLHQWRERDPALFAKLRHLGVSKLYVLVQLEPRQLAAMAGKTHFRIPSSGHHKTLAAMTFAQFLEALGAAVGKPKRLVPAATVAMHVVRRAVRRVIRAIAALADFTTMVDRDDVAELHDDLLDAAHHLGAAFAIDSS